MGSPILNKIGLGNIDILFVIIFLVLCIVILLVMLIIQNRKLNDLIGRYEKFMQGLGKTYILPAKPDEKITVVKESKKEESKTIEMEEMEKE